MASKDMMGIVSALALSAAAFPVLAQAQAQEVTEIDEIVVTAQKRSQNIQDVPISVSAIGGEALREQGLTSTADLSGAVPGLVVNDYGNPVITVITLRGVSQFDFGDHQESPVAVFVDGSYVPYLSAVGANMFDLERAEVLRGPQGTLFGRNATGGVIQLISAKPTEDFSGYGLIQAGDYGAIRAEGAVSGPIAGSLLGRLSVVSDKHDGYVENALGADKGDADNLSWRAQLSTKLGASADATLTVRGSRDRTSTSPYQSAAAYPDPATGLIVKGPGHAAFCAGFFGSVVGPNATDCVSGDVEDNDPGTIRHNRNGGFERDYLAANLTIDMDVGDNRLTSVTSFGSIEKNYFDEDSDGTSADILYFGQTVDARDFSQELRLSGRTDRADWVVGAYYLDISGDYGGEVGFFPGDPGFEARVNNAYSLDTRSWAVFGQGEFKLTPEVSLIAGLRWTRDEKTFRLSTPCVGPGCSVFGFDDPSIVQGSGYDDSVPGARTKRSSDNWDGRLQLTWKPNPDLMVYAGVSRGTKAGGYNAGSTALYTVDEVIFDDEVLTAYETGFKRTFAEGRGRLNMSAYYYDYADVQVFNQLGPSTVTFNRDGRVYGADMDLQWRPAEGLDLALGASLLDSQLDPIARTNILTGTAVLEKQELTNAPKASLNALARKQWSIGPHTLTTQADVQWFASRKLNLIDHPALRQESYGLLNLRAAYGPASGAWEVAVFAQNVTDEAYRVAGAPFVDFTGAVIEIYGPPCTIGASLLVKF